jgi:hypothetical protein
MARMAGDWNSLICLALLSIMVMLTSGCIHNMWLSDQYDTITENVCEKMSGMERDHCYQYAARVLSDKAQCDKINHPGPKSKCRIYLRDCSNKDMQWNSTGDGAYTKNDCLQYNAIQYQSIKFCEEMQSGYGSGYNDLNPGRVSRETCIQRVTEKCGHIGQEACNDKLRQSNYCVEGQMDRGQCVPEG